MSVVLPQIIAWVSLDFAAITNHVAHFYLRNLLLHFTGFTALDALELGFRTILLEDCSRGIAPDPIKETLERIKKEGGLIINSSEVITYIQIRKYPQKVIGTALRIKASVTLSCCKQTRREI